jgi:hypothetical protein
MAVVGLPALPRRRRTALIKAIKMIREINVLVPELNAQYITKSINSNSYEEKEKSYQRFSVFWKMTLNSQLSDRHTSQINKLGMFMMIEFLDDENPLLRHASKNWLVESISSFDRIVDPLLDDMIRYTTFYLSEGGQYFFTDMYDTDKVFNRFKKLKNILTTITELFSEFILKTPITQKIRKNMSNLFENDWLKETKETITYFELIVVICVRYIQGQALESISPLFAKENQKVSSVACELFDLVVTHIPSKSLEIAKYVYKPLLTVQRHAVANKNFVIQVQLLSLLKYIIFGKSTLNSEDKKGELLTILDSPMLMPKIIQGLYSKSPYVLIQYVNFINNALPYLCDVLPQQNLETLISNILKTYRLLIEKYSTSQGNLEDEGIRIQEEKVGESKAANISVGGGNLFESSGLQLQSNLMELISILIDGIQTIYNHFLGVAPEEPVDGVTSTPESGGIMSAISFGLIGSKVKRSDPENPKFIEISKVGFY